MSRRRRPRRHVESGELQRRGGLILPGQSAPGVAQLVVPGGYTSEPPVIVGHCSTCPRKFYRGEEEEWQRHVGRCFREHEGEVLAARADWRRRNFIFTDEAWDPEFSAHMRRVGDRMIAEGRLEMRPNERSRE